MLRKLDLYIIRKFLGTYFFLIGIMIIITVIFDLAEKLDNFMEKGAPVGAVIFDYYLNFIPYFMNMLSSLFTFIAVIFFTSKLAYNTEIIAMLSGGISFNRLLYPYMIAAVTIMGMSYGLSNWIIPHANKERIEFEDQYITSMKKITDKDIHVEIEPGIFIYIDYYNASNKTGRKASIEKFDGNKLVSKTTADQITYNSDTEKWRLTNFVIRDIEPLNENITRGRICDTTLSLKPDDFVVIRNYQETLNATELNEYIARQKARGLDNVERFIVEKHRRLSDPFSAIILTIIGVAVSSRKVRGGTGLHIGIGILISFSYIFFQRISTTFAINGDMDPFIAVWLPNWIFIFVALWLYRAAPK